ncbi:(2Fe-2S)-binding protein [Ancylobacter sonchi]|uniref:(2Fe-2S)-binding protein n=1 Tax=Ancylobacter sonchi TaxID=1937790 RepID=UPI001BD5BFD4|nr:(2Fe-2S)-binding protein [Ancylobacter sonchi]MBS7537138.1 (2Fe-2S)-binding protein [Ancylobacter sonchi]
MIVCSCNVLSDTQVRAAIADPEASVRTAGQVYRCLGCSPQCGRCARTIRKLIDDINAAPACGACPLECAVKDHAHDHAHGHGHAHEHVHTAEQLLADLMPANLLAAE